MKTFLNPQLDGLRSTQQYFHGILHEQRSPEDNYTDGFDWNTSYNTDAYGHSLGTVYRYYDGVTEWGYVCEEYFWYRFKLSELIQKLN